MFGNVIASGIGQGTGSVTIGKHTTAIKFVVNSGSSAEVILNNQTIKLLNTTSYEEFYGDYVVFEVTSGNVNWVALG